MKILGVVLLWASLGCAAILFLVGVEYLLKGKSEVVSFARSLWEEFLILSGW